MSAVSSNPNYSKELALYYASLGFPIERTYKLVTGKSMPHSGIVGTYSNIFKHGYKEFEVLSFVCSMARR